MSTTNDAEGQSPTLSTVISWIKITSAFGMLSVFPIPVIDYGTGIVIGLGGIFPHI